MPPKAKKPTRKKQPPKMGRPAYEPTAEARRQVEIWAGGGMSHPEICNCLGISPPTLRKYFEQELTAGAAKRKGEVIDAMYRTALAGNVSAQKAFLNRADMIAPKAARVQDEPKPAKTPRLGKKEQAELEAQLPASEYGDWGDVMH